MLESILREDLRLFFHINGQWYNGFLDVVLPFLREPFVWAPLYLFLGLFVTINYGWKGLFWILFFLLCFGVADQSSLYLKSAIGRVRPCRDPLVSHYARVLVVYCPMSGSFTSNHAANHFALATFCFITLKQAFHRYAWLFFVWAAAIAYAQVYVGVHYPLDVAGGAVLGILIGLLSGSFFQRRIRLESELAS
ncbi:undecaprenyl-diphosphatase [Chitinophaga ginsengisegetis]|uniref:Undecaprenyl-diphosphatase n=1 Tax=Chitinophaga ginsengisegetis TaxID=393003 RepID=A0A1T5NZZ5_9BACT|nr:phosphatase PAP2 family protein [Chitinophaga ginsengisegetis]MDR6566994.1 undecaprenyl-diphosphatase [Chitinophaga ginsengisegetis]MDR6646724.1 undecaprenyl-diphosphatase [Chitinophaga ginsengisegetis]MDR6653074.1 undecaprenyl-diphosphatase [Chitinophaga ginsengisegetis]SKD06002.1 undecaprenyl-diphosphatase [Chitinophaga ginsengisegetis]